LLEHDSHFPNYGFEVISSVRCRYELQVESADTCYIIKTYRQYQYSTSIHDQWMQLQWTVNLMEYSKEQLFWAFQILSAAVRARFLKLKRIAESENRFDHGHPGRLGCGDLVFVRLHAKHFSRGVGLLLFERDYTVYFR